jgi:hypothetical protein
MEANEMEAPAVQSNPTPDNKTIAVRKILLIILTSGLVTNAIYISALYYYKGLVTQLGFDSELFPIAWSDTPFWAYTASRQLGASYLSGLTNYFNTALSIASILVLFGIIYLFCRLVMLLFKPSKYKVEWHSYEKIRPMKAFVKWRKKRPTIVKIIFPVFKWIVLTRESWQALITSYYSLIFLGFFPLFLVLWINFPNYSLQNGERIGKEKIDYFSDYLCGSEKDYWSQCISISLPISNNKSIPKKLYGRLLLRHGNLLGLYTKDGPITLTMPSDFYELSTRNPCYEKQCKAKDSE